MSILTAIAYLWFILKDDYLVSLNGTLGFRYYLGPIDDRIAYGNLIAIGNKKHSIQLNGSAFISTEAFDIKRLTLGHFVLFATCLNYRVNFNTSKPNILTVIVAGCQSSPLGLHQQSTGT